MMENGSGQGKNGDATGGKWSNADGDVSENLGEGVGLNHDFAVQEMERPTGVGLVGKESKEWASIPQ